MPNLKEVKNRIVSVVSTQQITKAMKMVAAAKLRKAQDKITQMRPYASKLDAILKNLSSAQLSGDADNWYSQVETGKENIDRSYQLLIVDCAARSIARYLRVCCALFKEDYSQQFNQGNVTVLSIGKRRVNIFQSVSLMW
jgi:F-type H+-transporting ATPase subunit gamma